MRLLVTRAAEDAARTAARLCERGHEAVIAPVIAIRPTGAAPPAESWDAALLTSAHGASALAQLGPLGRPVFAVGPRTGAAAAGAGAVHVAEGDAAALAALVRRTLPPGATLLHVAGRHRKAEPAAALAAAGYRVLTWEAYEAAAVPRLPAAACEALAAGRVDGVLHFSRRSAAILVDRAAAEGCLDRLLALPQLCLSADVAAPLRERGARRVVVSAQPEERFLLDAIDTVPRALTGGA
ncbi:MAG TPA: uroporphyrinogen-III synthase [Microvirga sp.]|nr:uroporphyrinogen-III synthase [Microvirga sp.]